MIKRLRPAALALALCMTLCPPAARCLGESDLQDAAMARLAVIAQRDEPITDIRYKKYRIGSSGCSAISIVNALSAIYGVEDPAIAYAMVPELLRALSNGTQYKDQMVNAEWFNRLFDPGMLAAERDGCPTLSALLAGFDRQLALSADFVSAEDFAQTALSLKENALLTGRIYLRDGWSELVTLMHRLHKAGMDDACITLAFVGVGRTNNDAPLRSGKNGHYLTLSLPVGAFFETGSIYVLDSLPRAIEGESYGPGQTFTVPYHFLADGENDPFNRTYAAARISRTIIRLSLREEAQSQLDAFSGSDEARIALHSELLEPLVIYGNCLLFLSID